MTRNAVVIVAAVACGAAIGIGIDRAVVAQQPGIKRTVLQRVDDPGSKTHEAVMAVAELAPGGTAGRHRHPGVEIGYVLEGTVVFEHAGRQPVTKKAGEFFQNDVAAAHDAKNVGSAPAKVLAIYVVEKGKPLAEPVQ
jgi:quercetin dioxygenase-like cupin family protein